jgi:hypothetical protein
MSVYFGSDGSVELKRKAGAAVFPTLDPADVSVLRRRFTTSEEANQVFVTGDQVDIARTDKNPDGTFKNLELIPSHNFPDWRGYIFVDEIGGLRLYTNFEDAVTGRREQALELIEPSEVQNLKMQTRNSFYKCLSRITQFDFTTERETIDITNLGDNFRQQYEAGLISGQGTLDCFWEHADICPTGVNAVDQQGAVEFPAYLAQLCVLLVQGADFLGRFFIYNSGTQSGERSVWYEAECIVTNCTVTVPAGGVVETTINFVTTGKVSLRTGYPPIVLLQENLSEALQESGDELIVQVDND